MMLRSWFVSGLGTVPGRSSIHGWDGPIQRALSREHFLWSPSINTKMKAQDLSIANTLHDYFKQKLFEVPIVKIEPFQADTMYDIKLKGGHHYFFGDNLLGMVKECSTCTGYLDWIPVRVVYTVPSGRQIRVTGDGIAEFIG
jgi:hypothetical protein